MTKSELRKIYTEKRKTLSQDEVLSLSGKIFDHFLAHFKISKGEKVHCFLSIIEKNEIDTSVFLDYLFTNDIRVFVPKIVKGELISIEITKETPLMESSWGIKEPSGNEDCGVRDYDFVITPLLYADQLGNRVGYGKGFYDRFFSEIITDSIKIGVSFFPPKEKVDDVSDFDVQLDYLVTPTEVLSFGSFESKSTK